VWSIRKKFLKKVKKFIFSPNLTPSCCSQYGSVNPAAIMGSGIAATTINTVAVTYCKLMDRGLFPGPNLYRHYFQHFWMMPSCRILILGKSLSIGGYFAPFSPHLSAFCG